MILTDYHSKFAGGVRWRINPAGRVEVEGEGCVACPPGVSARAAKLVDQYKADYAAASSEFQVPVELLIACSLTEAAVKNPESSLREEPGFVSDAATPHRVSAGFCQLLISTARAAMGDPTIDRNWLFNVRNSLRGCSAYIKQQHDRQGTSWDPVLVACAYNAGGLYEQKGPENRWKLRQFPIGTGRHADRFVQNFNAARQLVDNGALNGHAFIGYLSLLGAPAAGKG